MGHAWMGKLELDLAERAGLNVARSDLAQVGGRHVLVVDRFDRGDGLRTGFTSALTMLEASDGEQRSYLEIAEVIERHSSRAVADLRELYRRIVFSILPETPTITCAITASCGIAAAGFCRPPTT